MGEDRHRPFLAVQRAFSSFLIADDANRLYTRMMPAFEKLDPVIEKWVSILGTKLFTESAHRPARFFYTPGDPPFECFQISVAPPKWGRVKVHARAVDTNDDVERELEQVWKGSVVELDDMLAAAVETINTWKTRTRQVPDPPSPW
ncbi:hypothetical protein [Sphingobium sp. CCH11-B1]|uniref:hypothetical protein n=1 Tax=Sphingobium sp. CCH11-B1 TaxID=1768781 RepID=UPI000AAC3258|nr:hypothetical protein [Sphingobium sp. CCH11-B1]MEA3391239.1 hypothetical protein [Pseudomonadota bacterium]